MYPHKTVVCQELPHHKDPYRHVLDIIFETAVKLVIVCQVMHLMAGSSGVFNVYRRVEARPGKKRRVNVDKIDGLEINEGVSMTAEALKKEVSSESFNSSDDSAWTL